MVGGNCAKLMTLFTSFTDNTVTKHLTTLLAKISLRKFFMTYIRYKKIFLLNPHRVLCNTFLNISKSEEKISTTLNKGVKIDKLAAFLCKKPNPCVYSLMRGRCTGHTEVTEKPPKKTV